MVTSFRGTCRRRQTGAVLVDYANHIISTGYNGNATYMKHCIETPCEGATLPSGTALDKCEAIHAEINAIAHCSNPKEIHTAYLTTSPCKFCTDALLATPCASIVFLEEYPHPESKDRWLVSGRSWRQFEE